MDYEILFDSIAHSWFAIILKITGVSGKITSFFENIKKHWKIKLNKVTTSNISIDREIFQGDSFSAL